jgi:hypothetical protein
VAKPEVWAVYETTFAVMAQSAREKGPRDDPSRYHDIVRTSTGKGVAAFARARPDTPGKPVAHAYSNEHMELPANIQLARVAAITGRALDASLAQLGAVA